MMFAVGFGGSHTSVLRVSVSSVSGSKLAHEKDTGSTAAAKL